MEIAALESRLNVNQAEYRVAKLYAGNDEILQQLVVKGITENTDKYASNSIAVVSFVSTPKCRFRSHSQVHPITSESS